MAGPGQARFYSSTAVQTSLAAGISAANTSFQVNSASGFPASTPFVLSLDQNSLSEELVLVGNLSGTTCSSVTRGFNGTTAQTHNNGASAVHVMCAQDLTDPSAHIGAYDAVHGLSSGSLVVGTTDNQTLTNKTLTSPVINTPSLNGSGGALGLPAGPDTLVGQSTAATLTNKTLTSPVINGASGSGTWTVTAGAAQIFQAGSATSNPLIVRGFASQSNALFIVQDSTPVDQFNIHAGGNATFTPDSTTAIPVTISAPASSTAADVLQLQNNGTAVAGVTLGGAIYTKGLTGATSTGRWVGSTAGGAPTSGTFAVGDFVDDNVNGGIWTCVTAGSPGTWVSNSIPRLPLAPISTTSNGTATGGGATEIQDSVLGNYAPTLTTGRTYKLVLEGTLGNGSVVGDIFNVQIRDGGASAPTTASPLLPGQTQWVCLAVGTPGRTPVVLEITFTVASSGVHTLGLFYNRTSGTGVFTPVPAPSGTRRLYVQDIT